jgi:hypothetical protein
VNPVNRSYATDQAVTVALHPGGAGVALPGLVLLAVLLVPPERQDLPAGVPRGPWVALS